MYFQIQLIWSQFYSKMKTFSLHKTTKLKKTMEKKMETPLCMKLLLFKR